MDILAPRASYEGMNADLALLPVVVVLLGGAGYLIKRHLSKAHFQERAVLTRTATDMLVQMRQHGFTLEDVKTLESYLMRQEDFPGGSSSVELIVRGAALDQQGDRVDELGEPSSSAQLNASASKTLEAAETRLSEVAADLMAQLDDAEKRQFVQTQEAWSVFREHQARFTASPVEGGTMYPLLYASTMIDLTEARIADVVEEAEWRRRTMG